MEAWLTLVNACWAKAVENDWNIINNNIKDPTLFNLKVVKHHLVCFGKIFWTTCPTNNGTKTDNPNCFIVWAYNSCTVESPWVWWLGLPISQVPLMYICNNAGVMNAPKTFPIKTSHNVKISLPCACFVITTFEDTVVGHAWVTIKPINNQSSICPLWLAFIPRAIP